MKPVSYSLGLLALCLAFVGVWQKPALDWTFEYNVPTVSDAQPYFQKVFDYTSEVGTAHSPAIEVDETGFSLLWFDGIRESHNDVVIKKADVQLAGANWLVSEPYDLFTRQSLSAATYPKQTILTLGNTIEHEGFDDSYLATIVSIGGWAMASIAHVSMEEDRIDRVEKLSLSPALNRSHLVRSQMIAFENGDAGLPAYFELGNAFGELVRINSQGRVVDKRRIGAGRLGIQPVIVVQSPKKAVALLRNFKKKPDWLLASWTEDGGQSWSPLTPLDLPNPNAPVAAVSLSGGAILMAFNDSATHASNLKLAVSEDGGRNWRRIATLEDRTEADQNVRYPMMRRLPDGQIVLTYSWGSKKGIRAFVFNEAWVNAQ